MIFQTAQIFANYQNRGKDSAEARAEVCRLIREVKSKCCSRPRFERLHEVLRTLPMPSQKFALLCQRSHNAEAYHNRGETGATLFELNLILGRLERDFHDWR